MVRLTALDQQGTTWILDLDEIPNIELTYSVKELKDIAKRSSTWSKTVQIPGTKNNNLFFEQQFNVNVASNRFNPNHRININLSEGGVEILNGYLQLSNITIQDSGEVNYNVVLFGTFVDFASSLGEKLLTGNVTLDDDLDFSDIVNSIVYSADYVVSTWTGNSDSFGVVYPLIEYNDTFGTRELSNIYFFSPRPGAQPPDPTITGLIAVNKNLLPAIYVKRIWDRIFQQAGFRYTSDLINSQDFKKLFIANPNLDRNVESVNLATIRKQNTGADQSLPIIGPIIGPTPEIVLSFPTVNDPLGLWNTASNTFTAQSNGFYTFNISLRLDYFSSSGLTKQTCNLYLRKNTKVPIPVSTLTGNVASTGNGFLNTFPSNSIQLYLYTGDTIQFVIYLPTSIGPGGDFKVTTASVDPDSNMVTIQSSNRVMTSVGLLPDKIKQIDFVSSIIKMFNLIVETDPTDPNNLIITPRNEWIANGIVRDWSHKLDRMSGYDITLLSQEAYRLYKFSYQKDNDFYNKQYFEEKGYVLGSVEVEVDNDFLKDTNEINPVFGPSYGDFVSNSSVFINRINDYDGQTYKKVATAPKILVNNGVRQVSFTDKSNSAIYIGTPYGPTFGTYSTVYPLSTMYFDPEDNNSESIYFGNSINIYLNDGQLNQNGLYDNYWSDEIDSLSSPDAKFLKCKMWLEAKDIQDFRFNDKIYLQVEGNPSYWRLQKVVYRPGMEELSDVELIKIDDLESKPVVQKRRSFRDTVPTDPTFFDPGGPGNPDIDPTLTDGQYKNHPGDVPLTTTNINGGYYNKITGDVNVIDTGVYHSDISGDNNNIIGYSSYISVLGSSNSISNSSNSISIGLGNIVASSSNVVISGVNNIVASSSNVMVVGSNNIIPESANNLVVAGFSVSVPENATGLPIFEIETGISPEEDSIAIGHNVLSNVNTALSVNNIGIGYNALNVNIGPNNIGIGNRTLESNVNGDSNIAIGPFALSENISGINNIGIGNGTLLSSTGSNNNIAIGIGSMTNKVYGNNIGIGQQTLALSGTGSRNIAIGDASQILSEGNYNISIGFNSMGDATNVGTTATFSGNIAIGADSLRANDTGQVDIAIGNRSLENNISGNSNIAIGNDSLIANTTGSTNIAIGPGALRQSTTDDDNIAIGFAAMQDHTSGSFSVAIGSAAFSNRAAGRNVVAIGYNATTTGSGVNNAIALGKDAQAGDNQCVFGTTTDIIIPVLPNLTTAQRNSVTAVAGMHIFNTTNTTAEYYDGTTWIAYP